MLLLLITLNRYLLAGLTLGLLIRSQKAVSLLYESRLMLLLLLQLIFSVDIATKATVAATEFSF